MLSMPATSMTVTISALMATVVLVVVVAAGEVSQEAQEVGKSEAAADATTWTPALNKCCAWGERLDPWLRICEPSNDTASQGGWDWLNATVVEPSTLRPLPGGAEGAWARAEVRAGRRPCEFADTHFLSARRADTFHLLANGSLLLTAWRSAADARQRLLQQVLLSSDEWCGEINRGGVRVLLTCPCARAVCVNRCCNQGQVYFAKRGRGEIAIKCVRDPNATALAPDTSLTFHRGHNPLNTSDGVTYLELSAHSITCDRINHSLYLHSNLEASDDADAEGRGTKRFWLQRNGSALINQYESRGRTFLRQHFCLVEIIHPNNPKHLQEDILFCVAHTTPGSPNGENVYYILLYVSGAFFLLLTLLVHALVAELRASAHARALMSHCGALAVASATLMIGHVSPVVLEPWCTLSVFILQYFFLAAFFWLNIMCWDVARTFGATGWRRAAGQGARVGRRFVLYSLYAWGCPAAIGAVTIFLNFHPDLPPDLPLLPNIGVRKCWFDTKMTAFLFYYGPIALLLIANCVLLAVTTLRVRRTWKSTSILRRPTSMRGGGDVGGGGASTNGAGGRATTAVPAEGNSAVKKGERQMLMVLTRLFFLMGVTWVAELGMWLADGEAIIVWYVTDAINMLRGVVVFFLYCWKPPVLRRLRAFWDRWRRRTSCAQCACTDGGARGPRGSNASTSVSTLHSSLSLPELAAALAAVPSALPTVASTPAAAAAAAAVGDERL